MEKEAYTGPPRLAPNSPQPGDLVIIKSSTSPFSGWGKDWTTKHVGEIFVVRDAARDYYNNDIYWLNIWNRTDIPTASRLIISLYLPDAELVFTQ